MSCSDIWQYMSDKKIRPYLLTYTTDYRHAGYDGSVGQIESHLS